MATKYRVLAGECNSCGICVPECPLGAISENLYAIDPNLCNGCGDCADACPEEAIESYETSIPIILFFSFSHLMTLREE